MRCALSVKVSVINNSSIWHISFNPAADGNEGVDGLLSSRSAASLAKLRSLKRGKTWGTLARRMSTIAGDLI